ncbi:MAG: DNA methylase [Candidatus Parabeggiatoa sp. nov. 1]|nr:MAG: DNA methylase [Gammaproteobacteria bacterium]
MNYFNKTFNFVHSNLPTDNQPVECLGQTFKNDAARRAYFLEQLRDKLQQTEFKNRSGFPHATKKAILALSDPPYYTACPNPWLSDFIKAWAATQDNKQTYHREPFATDVSEGKNDPIYNAHSYHTKVPHKAIMRYILHYTQPGEIVFDGFCGTGMTGVAAQLCGDRRAVETLGYRVLKDGTILESQPDDNGNTVWQPFSKLGARRAVLNDLSPAATFIAYNYNISVDVLALEQEALRILYEIEAECGWMYQTLHACIKDTKTDATIKKVVLGEMDCPDWIILGHINYTVWAEVFTCFQCSGEVNFSAVAVDKKTGKVHDEFPCPHCDVRLTKRNMERAQVMVFDKVMGKMIKQAKQIPVLINYSIGKQRYEKSPDEFDLALLEKIDHTEMPYWFPTDKMIDGNESRSHSRRGITHVYHFYTKRSLWILSALAHKTLSVPSQSLQSICRFLFQQGVVGFSKLNRYSPSHFSQNNRHLSGTLYIGSQIAEVSPRYAFPERIKRLKKAFAQNHLKTALISTQSASHFQLADASFDYIFLDPPFGANLMYSELNFLWEAWLQVFTNIEPEAIVNKSQHKNLADYRMLMTACFKEAFRLLKHGRWMTMEFSNTQASIWNTLQTVLQEVGFVVANVSALDKKQRSFNAVTTAIAVKQDLIISAYKPNEELTERFQQAAGGEAGVWEFVRSHLKYLPPCKKSQIGELEFIAEREPRILYDRMLAYFIQHGYPVPISSQAFQTGLLQRFPERDGMIFLPEHVTEYERQRRLTPHAPQMEIAVSDERSAIDWLQNLLKKRPATYQEIHPEFIRRLGAGWKKYETVLELDILLDSNFLKYNGIGNVPSQIKKYLSSHFKELRNLAADDPALQKRAAEQWYAPDPHQAHDLEQLREKHLLREFETYRQNSQKRLKQFRLEAIRAGFKKAWGERDYRLILDMAEKLPESVLHEDDLLLWYDQALFRAEEVGRENG